MAKNNILKQQEEEQALPTAPFSYRQVTEEAEKISAPVDAKAEEEQAIASLKHYKPYLYLEQHIREQAARLKGLLDVPTHSMSEEEIGKRFIVANFGADQLLGILNYVDQLASAIGEAAKAPEGQADSSGTPEV